MSEFLGAAKMNRLTDGMSIDFRLRWRRDEHTLLAVNVPVMYNIVSSDDLVVADEKHPDSYYLFRRTELEERFVGWSLPGRWKCMRR